MAATELGIRLSVDGADAASSAIKGVSSSMDGLGSSAGNATAGLKRAAADLEKVEMSAKATAAALRNVPAQFTDIAVGLASGQAPLTVLLQQGGQLKDMFGGVGNAAKALGTYVASLITPFSMAAAAAGTLGYAYYAGSKEIDAYNKALILTGNAIGLTTGQLQDMATSMARVSGTQGKAAETLAAFAASGDVGADSLQKFSQAAINFEKATGSAVEETVKQFSKLGEKPLEASVKLNESTNFLTMSIYQQIKALEEQGKHTEAAQVAQDAYADTINQRAGQITANLGTIERAWNAVASAGKSAWDAILDIGRPDSPAQQIAQLNAKITSAQQNVDFENSLKFRIPGVLEYNKEVLQKLKAQRDELTKTASLAQIRAVDQGVVSQQLKDQIAFDKEHEKYMTNAVKLERELAKAKEMYSKVSQDGELGEKNRKAYEDTVAKLKDQYKDKTTPKAKSEAVERFGNELTATKQWLMTQERMIHDSYSAQQKSIEDAYKAEEISAAQYYARQLANDESSLRAREQKRAEAKARFDAEMADRVSTTEARPASKARSTALENLKNEAEQFTLAQEAARQKDLNSMAAHSDAMAREIDKESQKVTGSVDAYIADMQRKAQADATLLAAREAMAGQAPEIIAGMEAELKVRADAAKILDQTAKAYAKAAEDARKFEDELAGNFEGGKDATKEEIALLETLQSAARQARKKLLELGGAVDTSALDASITATAASIKAQTDKLADDIKKTLVDGIMSAGKDGGAGLRKALEDVLITKPFRIVVEAMIQPVSSAIAQGIMGQSLGAAGVAGAGGATGLQTALNGAALAVSTFGTNALGAAKAITLSGASMSSAMTAGAEMIGAGEVAAGAGMLVGAVAPYAIAAVAAKSLFDSMQGSVTPTGTFLYGGQGRFGGRQDFAQSGGLFGGGNTKNSSWFDPAPEVAKYMGAVESTITTSVKGWASAIGLSADAVDNYSKQVEVSIGGLDAKGVQEAIGKAFAGMADDIAQTKFGDFLLPLAKAGETFGQTLQRLGTDLTTVNGILQDLGKPLFSATTQGVQDMEALLSSLGGLDKFTQLANTLTTVNGVLASFNQELFDTSVEGAEAAAALARSVGGTDKLQMLASDLLKVNANLEKLGQPLLDISVASAQAAHSMLNTTEMQVKAMEAAERLGASYASFVSNLSNADTSSVASLQAAFNKALAAVTVSVPSIKGVADLTGVTQEQYSSYNDPQRSKLDAAAESYKSLQNAIDAAAKSAESAAKTAKEAADAAVKAYSDALKDIEKDTRNVNREIADFGKTDFKKKLSRIGYDSQDKLAELDELSAKAAELSATASDLSLKAAEATIGKVSTISVDLIKASSDLVDNSAEVAGNISDTLKNSTAALGDALKLAPAIASLFDEIIKGLKTIQPALQLVGSSIAVVSSAASTATGSLSAFVSVVDMSGAAAASSISPITSAGEAFSAVSPAAAAASTGINALSGAFDAASSALESLTGTFGAASAAIGGLNAAFGVAAAGLGGLTSALSSATDAGASLVGSMGSVSGALIEISSAAASAAGGIASAASAMAEAAGAAASEISAAASSASAAQATVSTPTVVVAAATGGAINGPGTSTSDSIPAMLSDGEYVIKASSVAKYGTGFLDALNAGTLKSTIYRASGGAVDANASAQQTIVYLNEFQSAVEFLGGVIKRFEDSSGNLTSFAIQASETFSSAAAKLSGANLNIDGLDAAGVKELILGILKANQPTVDPATGLLKFSDAALAALAPLEAVFGSVETVLKGLEEQKQWQEKLDILTGKSTERQQSLQKDLASTTDAATQALIRQVYAQEDLNKAAKDTAEFNAKILAITGDDAGAALEQRTADLVGVTDALTIAQYDLNKAREDEIEWLTTTTDTLKSLSEKFAGQEVDLNRALGNDTIANKLQKDIELEKVRKAAAQAQAKIEGPDFVNLSALDQATLLGVASTADLIEKQYDMNEARAKEITLLNEAKSRLTSLTDSVASKEVERKRALGDTAGADAAQAAIDLADIYKSSADATALLANATTDAEKDTLRLTIATNQQAISNYYLIKAKQKEIDILNERKGLQDQLDDLIMSSTDLLAKQRDALDESNRALFDNIQATNAKKSFEDTIKGLIDTGRNLDIDLLRAKGSTAAADAIRTALDMGEIGKSGLLQNARGADDANAISGAYDLNKAKQMEVDILNERKGLQEQLDELTMTSTELLNKQRDALSESNRALFDEIQLKKQQSALRETFNGLVREKDSLQLDLLTAQGKKDEANALKQSQALGAFGQKGSLLEFAATLQEQESVIQAYKTNQRTRDDIAVLNERNGLQDKLDDLTMTSTQLLDKQRNALNASNHALFDQIQAVTKAKQAAEERKGIQAQLDELTLSNIELLDKQRLALDETNRALFDQVQAAKKYKEIAEERKGLESQLLQEQGNMVAIRNSERAAIDESNRLLFDRINALKDERAAVSALQTVAQQYKNFVDAVENAKSSAEDAKRGITGGYLNALDAVTAAQEDVSTVTKQAGQDLANFGKQIREFVDGLNSTKAGGLDIKGQAASAQADYAITLAQAQAGDKNALGNITSKASTFLALAENTSLSQTEYRILAGQVKGQLFSLSEKLTTDNAAAAAESDQMAVAQEKLAKAQKDLAEWTRAVSESGASTERELIDYAQDWREANTKYLKALGDKNLADAIVGGLDTTLKTPLEDLAAAVAGFKDALSLLRSTATGAATATGVTGGKLSTGGSSATAAGGTYYDVTGQYIGGYVSNDTSRFAPGAGLNPSSVEQSAIEIAHAYSSGGVSNTWVADSLARTANTFGISSSELQAIADKYGLPTFATGTNYVPRNMVAVIHEGEAIVPKAYNPSAGATSNERLEKLVEALTAEVQRLQALQRDSNVHIRRTADATNGAPEAPMLTRAT